MRKWTLIAGFVAIAALGYLAWPFIGMAQLASAVHSRDVEATEARIDAPAVRRSILTQILDEATRGTDAAKKLGPLGRSAAVGLLRSALDGEIGRFLDAEGIRLVLQDGRLPAALEADLERRSPSTDLGALRFARLPRNPLGTVKGFRFRSPITFEVELGEADSPDSWVRLRLRRTGLTWRLTTIELPRTILDRLKPLVQEKLDEAGM